MRRRESGTARGRVTQEEGTARTKAWKLTGGWGGGAGKGSQLQTGWPGPGSVPGLSRALSAHQGTILIPQATPGPGPSCALFLITLPQPFSLSSCVPKETTLPSWLSPAPLSKTHTP